MAQPLVTSSDVSVKDRPARATEEQMAEFFKSEFTAAAAALPGKQTQFGRATHGAALGFLAKYYLNAKKWTEAAATSKQLMDSGAHRIFVTQNRIDLFALQNEGNAEMMYVLPLLPQPNLGSNYISLAAPNDYRFQYHGKVTLLQISA